MKNCKIKNCERKYYAKEYCEAHYQRVRTGRPIDAPLNVRGNDKQRFMFYVKKTATCWLWTGTRRGKNWSDGGGYGKFYLWDRQLQEQKSVAAHRYSYEIFKGSIPDGLQLDHLCMNRLCVNPKHLEPVTNSENQHRAKEKRGHWPIEGREPKEVNCVICGRKIIAIQYERRKYCSNSCKCKAQRKRKKERLLS
jgi:hypothetical protein